MNAIVNPSLAARLRALTPARVGLGRTGVSQQTRDLLGFQLAHAQARDAVHAHMGTEALAASVGRINGDPVVQLHSAAGDRMTYLKRPDLGRRLDDASRASLGEAIKELSGAIELALIVADGLSALAVERHVPELLKQLLPLLRDWQIGPICVVEQGRVAIGDEIGELLGAQLSLVLIGERPGLSSPDSLGAYLTWLPRKGRTDAERNCISNIRIEGLSYGEATNQLVIQLSEARRRQLTGVVQKEASRQLGGASQV